MKYTARALKTLAALALFAGLALLRHAAMPAGGQATTDYDGLIDYSLDKLNAIRWDLDGNGIPAAANTTTYAAVFPNRNTSTSTPMGCPSTCTGYELTANLDFDADGSGSVTTDPSPTGPASPVASAALLTPLFSTATAAPSAT